MGRPLGSRNKHTLHTRETVVAAILSTYKALGGEKFMLEWARQEPTEFMRIYAKLLPKEEKVTLDGTLQVKAIERIIVKAK